MIFHKAAMKFLLPSLLLLKQTSSFHAHLPRKIDGSVLPSGFSSPSYSVFERSLKHQAFRRFTSTSSDEETSTEKKKKNEPRHEVRSGSAPTEIDPEELKLQSVLAEHQQNAARLGYPTDVRTLVEYNHGFAVMCTNSKANPGFPGGSVVGFAPDEFGRPIFIFSGMAIHTQDILKDPRCSITIASKEFKGNADGRVNLMGEVKLVPKEEREHMKEIYLKKHPGAFWVEFGDFNFFRMDEIVDIRFVGGFARVGGVAPKQYLEAKPDPVSEYGGAIAAHMNEDHSETTVQIVAAQIPGLEVEEATITSVDSLGMFVKVKRTPRASDQPQEFKIRLPFPRQAENRGDVKTLIIEMMTPTPTE